MQAVRCESYENFTGLTVQHVTTKWLRLLGSKSTLTFSSGTCEIFIFSLFHRFFSPPLKTVDTSSRPLVYITIWELVTASETTGVFCCFFAHFGSQRDT